ncbi:MAG: type II toxin-antitoxin system VapC family toxin [Chloroflexi bacterium]|nr:type II toxin-antitoxin system VapC family toxin [Chloroflexota bacterium]
MGRYILDASALLALLNDEAGAEVVQGLLPHAVVSAVNLAEVITRLSLLGMPMGELHQALDILGVTVIPFDESLAYLAGALATTTKTFGLSLGDRACLALARQTGGIAVTSDLVWQEVKIGIEIQIIR